MPEVSALGPVDPSSINVSEEEKHAPWIVRKLVGSMTGRIVMSSYETLRSAGTGVICLSPWGDSSPLVLPCIRFRDLAVHTVVVATGGMAAVAAPAMGPVADIVIGSFGDSLLVEMGLHTGFELSTKLANDLVIDKSVNAIIPIHSNRLETTGIKTMLMTLKYKHTVEDAALGFFRSSVHQDTSLFASVLDYLAVEKGWFSPYLWASGRRPIIPRSMKPDVVFCHGPFLSGDYRVGETLLAESASVITFCPALPPSTPEIPSLSPPDNTLHLPTPSSPGKPELRTLALPMLSKMFPRSRTPSPEPVLTALPAPPAPRRLVLLLVGLGPHRKLWTTSQRPNESVLHYQLLNGCPAVVLPAKIGAPLLAWVGLTLEQLWRIHLPAADALPGGAPPENMAEGEVERSFEGVVGVMNEYLDLCVDWERVIVPEKDMPALEEKRATVKDAVMLLIAAAVRSKDSKQVQKEVDKERAGLAMWRIP